MSRKTFESRNTLFPMEKTVAVVNKDVLTLWGKCNDMTITGFGYSDMDGLLASVASGSDRYIMPEPEASKGMFYRSDHLPFMRCGVPAMFAKGWNDICEMGPEQSKARINDYWNNICHSVRDEITPDDDYPGLKQGVDISLDFILSISCGDRWLQWSQKSHQWIKSVARWRLYGTVSVESCQSREQRPASEGPAETGMKQSLAGHIQITRITALRNR